MDKEDILTILPFILLIGFLLTLMISTSQIQDDNKKFREEQAIKNQQLKDNFHTLNCPEQKEYLKYQNLRGSTLFDYNINEEFYREYVLICHDEAK